jgi:alpha-1,3-glucosyltransferase
MKWESKFSKNMLMMICFFVSTLFSVPSILGMILSSSKKVLTLGFFSISMTFFLFSYHVHEKSILLPLLMVPFLSKYLGYKLSKHLVISGCVGNLNLIVGMYHLLYEDGQSLQYFSTLIIYIIVIEAFS